MNGYWSSIPVLILVSSFYAPLAVWLFTLLQRLGTDQWVGGNWHSLLLSTLTVAGSAAVVAAFCGCTLALLSEVFPVGGRAMLTAILLLPLLLPSVVLTTTLNALLAGGPLEWLVRGSFGAVFISSLQMSPLVFWGVSRELAAVPQAERDAMRLALPSSWSFLRVLAGRAKSATFRYALLAFVLLFPRLEVPLYAQGGLETIGIRILGAFSAQENDLEGLLLTGLSLLVVLPMIAICGRSLARVAPVPLGLVRGWESRNDSSWPARFLWFCAITILFAFSGLLRSAWAPVAEAELVYNLSGLFWELLRTGLLAALMVLAGWAMAERKKLWLAALCIVPSLIPGSLPGLILSQGVQQYLPLEVLRYPLLMSMGQGVRFAAVAYLFGIIARESIPAAERNAGLMLARGAGWLALRRVAPQLATGALIIMVLLLGEVESAAMLVPAGYSVPAVDLHQLLHFRFDESAARVSLALAASVIAISLLLSKLGRGLR